MPTSQIISGEGYVTTYYPIPKPRVISHILESSGGHISINPHNNATDTAHLVLKGNLSANQDFIRCEKINGAVQFRVDGAGDLVSATITADEVFVDGHGLKAEQDTLKTDLEELEMKVGDPTHVNNDGEIVVRNNTEGTEIENIVCSRLAAIEGGLGVPANISVYGEASFNYVPQYTDGSGVVHNKANALYRVGANLEELGDLSGAGDGLVFHEEYTGDTEEILIQVQQDAPTIRMVGNKNQGINFFEIIDENDDLQFGITQNGSLIGAHLTEDTVSNITDHESHSVLLSSASLYIGPMRISYRNGEPRFEHLVTIPTVLAAAPYNVGLSDLNGRDPEDLTARQWVVLARQKADDITIRARDIFTNSAEWVSVGADFSRDLTSSAQDQFDDLSGDMDSNAIEFITQRVVANSVKAPLIKAAGGSVWLGSKLHISEKSGRAQLQYRKDTIPKYLQDLVTPVLEADVTALGTTIALCTIDQWESLSVAKGGSGDLSVIFDQTNVELDFELKSSFNELLVTPQKDQENAGITISQPTTGHPVLVLKGNDHASGGRGLIAFENQSQAYANIYSSSYDDHLHINVENDKDLVIIAANIELDTTTCTITRDTREVFTELTSLQTQIDGLGGGGSLGPTEVVEATNVDATLTIKTTGADTSAGLMIQVVDTTSGNDESRLWEIKTEPGAHNELVFTNTWLGVQKWPIRIFGDGSISFTGATSATRHIVFQNTVLCKETLYLWGLLDGTQFNSDVNLGTGKVTCGTLALAGTDYTSIPPPAQLVRNNVHMNPGGYTLWPILTGVTVFVHDTNQTSRYRLPEFPTDGQELLILTCAPAGQGTINIHTGAFSGRTFHWKSTGYASSVQCNLNSVGTAKFHCVYIDTLNQWLLV